MSNEKNKCASDKKSSKNEKEKHMKELEQLNNFARGVVKCIVLIIILLVGTYAVNFHNLSFSPDGFGQFGDYLGGILNPIVAFFALIILFKSVTIQKQELQTLHEEQQKITDIQNEQIEQLKKQLEQQTKQSNQEAFFQNLDLYQNALDDVKATVYLSLPPSDQKSGQEKTEIFRGKDALNFSNINEILLNEVFLRPNSQSYDLRQEYFQVLEGLLKETPRINISNTGELGELTEEKLEQFFYSSFRYNIKVINNSANRNLPQAFKYNLDCSTFSGDNIRLYSDCYKNLLQELKIDLTFYFRILHNILKNANEMFGKDEYRFIKLFRASLNINELFIISFNILFNEEGKKSRDLVKKYGLLKHIPIDYHYFHELLIYVLSPKDENGNITEVNCDCFGRGYTKMYKHKWQEYFDILKLYFAKKEI